MKGVKIKPFQALLRNILFCSLGGAKAGQSADCFS